MLRDPSSSYVYVYYSSSDIPYYVGRGTWGRAYANHGKIPLPSWDKIKIIECTSRSEAVRLENSLINELLPVSMGGTLMNRVINGGHMRTKEEIGKALASRAAKYRYRFITPDGSIHEPDNVMHFVADHGLNYSAVRQVAIGNRSMHKGWRIERYACAAYTTNS
jgi:hypothetical protein